MNFLGLMALVVKLLCLQDDDLVEQGRMNLVLLTLWLISYMNWSKVCFLL